MQLSFFNFTEYNPQRTAETLPLIKQGVVFIKDNNGNDWRKLAKELVKNKELVHYIVVDKYNAVAAYANDPTLLFPVNCDLHIVESVPAAKFADCYYEWSYVNGKFVKHSELQKVIAEERLQEEQAWVEVQLDTEEDEERIIALHKFRADLLLLVMSDAPHIDWPVRP